MQRVSTNTGNDANGFLKGNASHFSKIPHLIGCWNLFNGWEAVYKLSHTNHTASAGVERTLEITSTEDKMFKQRQTHLEKGKLLIYLVVSDLT